MKKVSNTANLFILRRKKTGYFYIKPILDVCGALLGLIVLLPIFLIVALFIKMEEPKGPVFFKQIRVGKDGKEFYMYKFRSMCVNAEEKLAELLNQNEVDGAMFKIKHDPRITNIGRFIRKTSIDELPQLVNVLKRDMSLVGPRPPLQREVVQYTEYDKQRLTVTPGCTGLWQVSGRNNLNFDQMVELDIQYINSMSFKKDIEIIFKTITVMLGDDNAF